MLEITTHTLGNATMFRCAGRITVEHADKLRTFVMKHAPSIAVLDLAEITAMDAAGVEYLSPCTGGPKLPEHDSSS